MFPEDFYEREKMNSLFFDTETTGIPRNYKAPVEDVDNWPRLVQIGWILFDDEQNKLSEHEFIICPDGFEISVEVSKVHGITQEKALSDGWKLPFVLGMFTGDLMEADRVIGHNLSYDLSVVGAEMFRLGLPNVLNAKSQICTMKSSTNYCQIPGGRPWKWPKLHELYHKLFNEPLTQTHTALDDIQNTAKCYFELKRLGVIE
jgi:DNA polymerase-3 subunit epsilon